MAVFSIAMAGYLLGGIKIAGIRLGASGTLLVALIFGHFGFVAPSIVRDMGQVLFVTTVGFIAGPVFVQNFKSKVLNYIALAALIVLLGVALCAAAIIVFGVPVPLAVGMFSGALTSTPGLAAAIESTGSDLASVGYGIAYPFGVVGVVLFVQLVPKLLRADMRAEAEQMALTAEGRHDADSKKTFIEVDSYGFFAFSLALILGLLVARINIPFFGGVTFNLGSSGGPLFVGLLFGHLRHVGPLTVTAPESMTKPMSEFGIILFLIGAGTNAGNGFIEVLRQYGAKLFLMGVVMTMAPMIAGFVVARAVMKLDMLKTLGAICGGMTSTPALGSLISVSKTDAVATFYAATYPIALIFVMLSCQFLPKLFT